MGHGKKLMVNTEKIEVFQRFKMSGKEQQACFFFFLLLSSVIFWDRSRSWFSRKKKIRLFHKCSYFIQGDMCNVKVNVTDEGVFIQISRSFISVSFLLLFIFKQSISFLKEEKGSELILWRTLRHWMHQQVSFWQSLFGKTLDQWPFVGLLKMNTLQERRRFRNSRKSNTSYLGNWLCSVPSDVI